MFEQTELPLMDCYVVRKDKRNYDDVKITKDAIDNFNDQVQYNIHIVAETPYYTKPGQPEIKANSEYIIDMVDDHRITKEELEYYYINEIVREFAKFGVQLPCNCIVTLSQDKYLKTGICVSNKDEKIEDLRLKMHMHRDEKGFFKYELFNITEEGYNEIKYKRGE